MCVTEKKKKLLSFFFFNDTATTEIYTFPYTTLFRSVAIVFKGPPPPPNGADMGMNILIYLRSEEHTSELQSQSNLVCRLLLEKKKRSSTSPTSLQHNRFIYSRPNVISICSFFSHSYH